MSTGPRTSFLPNLGRWQPWLLTAVVLLIGGLMFEALRGLIAELNYVDVVDSVRAAALLWGADSVALLARLSPDVLRAASMAILVAAAFLLFLCRGGRERRILGLHLRLPTAALAVQQLLISALDIGASAAVLWLLLPAGAIDLPVFVGFYAIAVALGGQVPVHPTSATLVEQTVLMGLGQKAAFEFHLGNWIGKSGDRPFRPEVSRLHARSTQCLYGKDEEDSLCPQIPAGHVRATALPGGHHFDGAYDELATLILK